MAGKLRSRPLWAIMIVVCAVAAWLPGAAGQGGRGMVSFDTGEVTIVTASARHRFRVEIARTGRQQALGLMFRRRLDSDAGMLFVYRNEQPVSMWMKNTILPLDMLFIAGDGRIVKIVERTVPYSVEAISSGQPVVAVLELNGGTTSRREIRSGDRVLSPALGN